MPVYEVYTLEASEISISNGGSLSGITQGDGSHLVGETITLNSNAWQTVNIRDNDPNFNDNDNSQEIAGRQTYDDTSYRNGTEVEAEYTLTVEDPDGNTYTVIGFNINEGGSGPDYATVEGLAFIGPVGGFPPINTPLTVVSAAEGPGGSATPYGSYATPPCFTPGTIIETAKGPRRIEDLAVGDMVRTLDDGLQPLRWIGTTVIQSWELLRKPSLRPIRIAKDTFGPNLPARDMAVSPMHRFLHHGPSSALLFGADQVLVAAKHMADGAQIKSLDDLVPVTYIHLCFDKHQIVLSDGLWSESFLPGEQVLNGLAEDVRAEFHSIFDRETLQSGAFTAARPCLKRHEARMCLAA